MLVNPATRAALEARLPSWVNELVQRGVAERKARQMALDIPEEQPRFRSNRICGKPDSSGSSRPLKNFQSRRIFYLGNREQYLCTS